MRKQETRFIIDTINEWKKAVKHYKEVDDLKSHEIASERLRALKELARGLGIYERVINR